MATGEVTARTRWSSGTWSGAWAPRVVAFCVLALVFAAVSVVDGPQNGYLKVLLWLWLASVCWNIAEHPRRHLEFLRDWSVPLALLVLYTYSRQLADNLGTTIHVHEPVVADRLLGGGDIPSSRLQDWMCGDPCNPTGPPQWYDHLLWAVWFSHFFVGMTLAVVLWVRNRTAWLGWMRRYFGLCFVALVGYVTYPMAPPWMASLDGALPHDVQRLTARGWIGPRPSGVEDPHSWAGNAVAAMPSLHAGVAFLVAIYAIQRLRSAWRWAALAYPVLMSFALVYLGEHYVVDVLVGAGCAVAVLALCSAWERWRSGPETLAPAAHEEAVGASR
ncbi:inositol phosphorylceramide synthase [Nocardioides guangzhouensis]|uniref:Inositol phosphorylceramide synthase n=1 Tax=Nocardioides guangzhouensis TaxID=2497878 RepID=A0A4Q4ZCE5_9ACTN|nr:phosphatase PAP2 family protein [Nocardioides guangzhouensis]RYP85653.1 inositol phosphorylceramide synthase [Nocardioides guangzhouensis]